MPSQVPDSLLNRPAKGRGPILVTGTAGKTGLAVLRNLAPRIDAPPEAAPSVRAMIRRPSQREAVAAVGITDIVAGDLCDDISLRAALEGVASIYHICPNVHPLETAIGQRVIARAVEAGVEHFVLHSVLHPQARAMPHHWAKLRVEEDLLESGLNYTILQPAPYMQNVLGQWRAVADGGTYEVPYAASTRISMVDLEDVAEVAGRVLTESGHRGAVYELAGDELLDQTEIASQFARCLDREVEAKVMDRNTWASRAQHAGLADHQIATLLAMFVYYERFGMAGNATVLRALLGRRPRSFAEFLDRAQRRLS